MANMQNAPQNQSTGRLFVQVYTGEETSPIPDAGVIISRENSAGSEELISFMLTNRDGKTAEIQLPAPSKALSLSPDNKSGYENYNIRVDKPGFYTSELLNVPVFSGNVTIQPVALLPLPLDTFSGKKKYYISEPLNLENGEA